MFPSRIVSSVIIPVRGSSRPNSVQVSGRNTVDAIRPLVGNTSRYVENSRMSNGPDQNIGTEIQSAHRSE